MAYLSKKTILKSCAIAAAGGLLGLAAIQPGHSQSPHATVMKFGGSWNGGGTITPLSGGKERLNCKVSFKVAATSFSPDIDCSGGKHRFDIEGNMNLQGSNISGNWSDKASGYSGGANGKVGNNKIDLNIEGPSFNGRMDIAISGGSQTVRVSQYDVQSKKYKTVADISLRK